jgi:hypothetical protein
MKGSLLQAYICSRENNLLKVKLQLFVYIVTNMTIARQRFGKHILEVTYSKVGPQLLGSNSPNTDSHGNGC